MMGGFGMLGMMGFNLLSWIINLALIGFVVYFAVKLSLRDVEKNKSVK